MSLAEHDIQSFIVKIRFEQCDDEAGDSIWRGHITHVPSGTRHPVTDLYDIPIFIAPYLSTMGVKFPRYCRMRLWLDRWTSRMGA